MFVRFSFPLLALVVLCGCSGGDGLTSVTGTVVFQGAPLKEGSIAFLPLKGDVPTSGAEIREGKYSARVPQGTMKVTISASKKIGERKAYDTPESPVIPVFAEALPPQYNEQSSLTLEVGASAVVKNWELP